MPKPHPSSPPYHYSTGLRGRGWPTPRAPPKIVFTEPYFTWNPSDKQLWDCHDMLRGLGGMKWNWSASIPGTWGAQRTENGHANGRGATGFWGLRERPGPMGWWTWMCRQEWCVGATRVLAMLRPWALTSINFIISCWPLSTTPPIPSPSLRTPPIHCTTSDLLLGPL